MQNEFLRLYSVVRKSLRNSQPWPTFFERFDLPRTYISFERRFVTNLQFFSANYLLLAFVVTAVTLRSFRFSLFLVLSGLAWTYVLLVARPGTWNSRTRFLALTCATIFLFYFVGALISKLFWAIFWAAIVVSIHATLRPLSAKAKAAFGGLGESRGKDGDGYSSDPRMWNDGGGAWGNANIGSATGWPGEQGGGGAAKAAWQGDVWGQQQQGAGPEWNPASLRSRGAPAAVYPAEIVPALPRPGFPAHFTPAPPYAPPSFQQPPATMADGARSDLPRPGAKRRD